jgi:hypothetical protein
MSESTTASRERAKGKRSHSHNETKTSSRPTNAAIRSIKSGPINISNMETITTSASTGPKARERRHLPPATGLAHLVGGVEGLREGAC